jgi:hypothetical protein
MTLTDLICYDLKMAALIAVFYLFYMLLLARETTHTLNRTVLLTGIVLSAVLPLCVITIHKQVLTQPLPVSGDDLQTLGGMAADTATTPLTHSGWLGLLGGILLAGILIRLLYVGLGYWKLRQMTGRGEHHRLPSGTKVCVVDAPVGPFSWMKTIVLSRADWTPADSHAALAGQPSSLSPILAHEEAHVRHRHSYDVVVVEVLTALQWFNPVVWYLRQELRTLHEYEADAAVISRGFDESQYIHLLMQKATGIQACALANGIKIHKTKKRIIMMLKPKSKRKAWLKALYIVPVAFVSLAMTAKTVVDYETTPTDGTAIVQNEDPVFEVCEQMPQYPGGEAQLMQFIAQNVKYPAIAAENGVQSRVLVQFIVEKDGSLSHSKVLETSQGTGEAATITVTAIGMTDEQQQAEDARNAGMQALRDEALRVVNAMPKWTPGKQRGQTVRVKYTIPITFCLQ